MKVSVEASRKAKKTGKSVTNLPGMAVRNITGLENGPIPFLFRT